MIETPPPTPAVAPLVRHRVVVVDADHRVRASLACLLGLGERLEVVGQAGHVEEALRLCEAARPDVVVVDPRLPDVEGGLALIAVLRRRLPDVRIAMLAWAVAPEHQLFETGADALLPKSLAPQELAERVAVLAETEFEQLRKEAV